jgi:tetratricopeptide (TPR) repeat protein
LHNSIIVNASSISILPFCHFVHLFYHFVGFLSDFILPQIILHSVDNMNPLHQEKKMVYKTIAIGLLSSLFFTLSLSQQSIKDLEVRLQQKPNDVETLVALGRLYHDQGAAGNEEAVDKGFTCLDKAIELDPTNAVAYAFRGSLWTMRGRDAWFPFTKLKHVDKGIDELDKAVDLAPDNITVHLTRGINSLQLPSIFKRLGTAVKDFSFLLADSRFPHLEVHLKSTIYYWAGIAYKRDNQADRAKEYLKKAISVAPESPTAKNAEKELKELS